MFKLRIVNRNESNVNIHLMTSDDAPKQKEAVPGTREKNEEDKVGVVKVPKKKVADLSDCSIFFFLLQNFVINLIFFYFCRWRLKAKQLSKRKSQKKTPMTAQTTTTITVAVEEEVKVSTRAYIESLELEPYHETDELALFHITESQGSGRLIGLKGI